MSKILAMDLGKFKSVTCLLDTETNETEFWTMSTDRPYLLTALQKCQPDLVVIESCSTSGWATMHARQPGLKCWSAIPTKRPGNGKTSNARRTATTRSKWPNWPQSAS